MEEKLESFRYKKDLVLLHWKEKELFRIIAAAYALIISRSQGKGGMLDAWAAGTPVIATSETEAANESDRAVLRVPVNNPELLAAAMMKLYKDEAERSALIKEGLSQIEILKNENQLGKIGEAIIELVNNQREHL